MADYIVSDGYETIKRVSEPNSIQLYPMTFKKVANYFRLALLNSKLEKQKRLASQIEVSAGMKESKRIDFLQKQFAKKTRNIVKLESEIKFLETGEETTIQEINCRMLKLQEKMMNSMRYNMDGAYRIPEERRTELFGTGIHEQARIKMYEQARKEEEKRLMDLINEAKQKESSEEKANSNQFTMTEAEMNQAKGQVENKFEEAEKKNEETPTYGTNDEIFGNSENVEEKVEEQVDEKVEEVPTPVETPKTEESSEKVSEEEKKEETETHEEEPEVEIEKTESKKDKNIRENIIVIPERKQNYEEKLVEQYKQLGEQSKNNEATEEMREEIQKTAEMAEKAQREEKAPSNALEKILNTDFSTISDEELEKMFDIKEVYEAVRMISNKRDILKAEEAKIDEARPIVDEIKAEVMDINKETVNLYRKFGDSLEEDCNRKAKIEINDLDAASTADDTIKMINEMLGEIKDLDGTENNNKEVKK